MHVLVCLYNCDQFWYRWEAARGMEKTGKVWSSSGGTFLIKVWQSFPKNYMGGKKALTHVSETFFCGFILFTYFYFYFLAPQSFNLLISKPQRKRLQRGFT